MKIQNKASANLRKCLSECIVNYKYWSNIFIILNTIERLETDHQGDKLNPTENKFNFFFFTSTATEHEVLLFWKGFDICWTKTETQFQSQSKPV